MGIEHALLPEKGLVVAGDVVIGAGEATFADDTEDVFIVQGEIGNVFEREIGKRKFHMRSSCVVF